MPSSTPHGRGLSLWWIPPRALEARLQGLIDTLAGRLGTPSFAPHVTVESGLQQNPEDIVSTLSSTTDILQAPELHPGAVQTGEAWNRTLTVAIQPDEAVLDAHISACVALGRTVMPRAYAPHLSLVYGPLDAAVREHLASGLRLDLEPFQPVALALVDTSGPVTGWWELHRWPLAGTTWTPG